MNVTRNVVLTRGGGRGQAVLVTNYVRGARRIFLDRATVDAALQARWISVDCQPDVPQFSGTLGLQVPLPDNPTTSEFISLILINDFVEMLVEQTNLNAASFKRNNTKQSTTWESK